MTQGEASNEYDRLREIWRDLGITNAKQRAALAAACINPTVTAAARDSGINLVTLLVWLGRVPSRIEKQDETFQLAWEVATEAAIQNLEREAMERAQAGVQDKSSADLLKFLLKGYREKFHERYHHKHAAEPGVDIVVELKDAKE